MRSSTVGQHSQQTLHLPRTSPQCRHADASAQLQRTIDSIRQIGPADAGAYRTFLNHVTSADLRSRAHSGIVHVSERAAAELLDPLGRYGAAYGAFDPQGTLLGVARLSADVDDRSYELALLVRSDRQRQGVGMTLLRHVLRVAIGQGVPAVTAHADAANAAALALADVLGFVPAWDARQGNVRLERTFPAAMASTETPAPQPVPPMPTPPTPAEPPGPPEPAAPVKEPPGTSEPPVEEPGTPAPPQRAAPGMPTRRA